MKAKKMRAQRLFSQHDSLNMQSFYPLFLFVTILLWKCKIRVLGVFFHHDCTVRTVRSWEADRGSCEVTRRCQRGNEKRGQRVWRCQASRQTPCTYYEYFTTDTQQLLIWTPRDGDNTGKQETRDGQTEEKWDGWMERWRKRCIHRYIISLRMDVSLRLHLAALRADRKCSPQLRAPSPTAFPPTDTKQKNTLSTFKLWVKNLISFLFKA